MAWFGINTLIFPEMYPNIHNVDRFFEVDQELITRIWLLLIEDYEGNMEQVEELCEKWPDFEVPCDTPEKMKQYLFDLETKGVVRDTHEQTCWSIAKTKQDAERALREEVSRWPY